MALYGYVDVDKLMNYTRNLKDKTIDCNDIARFPRADVVEVVRCKDCKHRDDNGMCCGRGWPLQLVPDDGFCDKGKRRNDGKIH